MTFDIRACPSCETMLEQTKDGEIESYKCPTCRVMYRYYSKYGMMGIHKP